MDPPKEITKPSLHRRAGLLSRALFSWIYSLLRTSIRRPLEYQDFHQTLPEEKTALAYEKLEREWNKELQKHNSGKEASLLLAMCKAFWKPYAFATCVFLVEDFLRIAQPLIFKELMTYFAPESTMSFNSATQLCITMCMLAIIQGFIAPHDVKLFCMCGLSWQLSLSTLVYRKILRLSNKSLRDSTTGYIMDLVSSDAERPMDSVWSLRKLLSGPLQAVVIFYFCYEEIGASVFAGYSLIFVLIPLQIFLGKLNASLTFKKMTKTDQRVSFMSEVINSIKVIKMFCWEEPFKRIIYKHRSEELNILWKIRAVGLTLAEMNIFNVRIITAAIFVTYILSSNELTATKIFPMMVLFEILNQSLLTNVSSGSKDFFETVVSLGRLQKFLLLEERKSLTAIESHSELPVQPPLVSLSKITAKWDKSMLKDTVTNFDLTVRGQSLLFVIGPVGAGKSSLLSLILGELPPDRGSVTVDGTVSYASQDPWIFSSTVRQNILFGNLFNAVRYDQVLKATAFTKDLADMPNGDLSRVGEKGITLSGGQKARLSLCRALYQEADIYLLDDPLSAVDANVGKHIFQRCIKGFLKDKLCILVTHQLQYLGGADKVLVLKEGISFGFGSYGDLLQSGLDLKDLLSKDGKPNQANLNQQASIEDVLEQGEKQKKQTFQEEVYEEESSKDFYFWTVFIEYMRTGSSLMSLLGYFFLGIIGQIAYNGCDILLAHWTSKDYTESHGESLASKKNISIFIAMTCSVYIISWIKGIYFFNITTKASKNLHEKMFTSLMRSPLRFFDVNPAGTILNRFSSNLYSVDIGLPLHMFECLQLLFIVAGNLLVIIFLNPIILLPIIPLGYLLHKLRSMYVAAQKNTTRVESLLMSPIYTHVKNSLEGFESIRALKAEDRCITDFDKHWDAYAAVTKASWIIFTWYILKKNTLISLFVCCTVISAIIGKKYLDPGSVGLMLSYAVMMIWHLQTVSRLASKVQIMMTTTERALCYTKLKSEWATESLHPPPPSWPQRGEIRMENVSLSYYQGGPLELKDISFTVNAGEKIGIVGRTGAGKSSLIQALFRLSEPEGNIIIDGICINTLGLHELRSKMSIIPQDPILFNRPLRDNLDPFSKYTDQRLWATLEEVQLKDMVNQLPYGLHTLVSEGGQNFSVGQKQLICLARATLCQNKILIMDEATANVDKRTDELIQATIRKTLRNCTVLTIAHRLNTIMDYDRVMVFKDGCLVEFDSPSQLLLNKNGVFSNLIRQS